MNRPNSMTDLRKLTDQQAGELRERQAEWKAAVNETTFEQIRQATFRATGDRHKAARAAERFWSAISAADEAFKEAAEAMETVHAEAKAAGVPLDGEWS